MKSKALKKGIIIATSVVVVAVVVLILVKVINGKGNKEYYDNETDALVFSTLEVDKVFSPFFSTSATDSNVVGLTQIGMLGNDKDGNVVFGDNEGVVTKDLEIRSNDGTANVDLTTTYYFVLKNDVRFSNGSYLTIKDVLFNLYVYLDPVYSGSSTIYSTDIVGLDAYRTQSQDETEQENFKKQFQNAASTRINSLIQAKNDIYDEHEDEIIKKDAFVQYLQAYEDSFKDTPSYDSYQYLVEDFNKTSEFFKEELETDWSNSLNSYEDIIFTDDKGNNYKNLLTSDVEAFFYNEGYITWNKKNAELTFSLGKLETAKNYTKEQAIDIVYNDKMPKEIDVIVTYWMTATTLFEYLVNAEMEKYFAANTEREFPNISGIKFANKDSAVTVNGKTYEQAKYNEAGNLEADSYEVLSITINNVDPKAIWNFSFAVAPMYYYSDQEHIEKFDYVANFGVEYGSQTFMNEVLKGDKIGVPVGAGPYAASKSSGGLENVTAADFYNLGVIYFERNPYYVLGPAKIKKVRYQVVSSNQMLNALYNGEVDFVEPNAKPETITELDGKKDQGISNTSIQTSGYGYIGINAGKIPYIGIRQAIMHAINTQECVDYYQTTAEAIYRPMSKSSWAYPEGCTPYYPYIGAIIPEDLDVVNPAYKSYVEELEKQAGDTFSEEEQLEFLRRLVEGYYSSECGYSESKFRLNANGIYTDGQHTCKYTFTIAGQETDHPAWRAMNHAMEILNKVGFNVNVVTDANALSKLSSGALTVWAAAWGSTIDPDMYQVYHRDSQATSVLNWGYKQILNDTSGNKYGYEQGLIDELSELIDKARETNDQEKRQQYYKEALDIVMMLGVELPTYQRDDLYAYNTDKIDPDSLTKESELSPYYGLTSEIHNVSLNLAK
jgi:peptide/nickel transport system substrate-binding protein